MDIYQHRAWRPIRAAVLARDGFRCKVRLPGCTETATAVDHVTPLTLGGAPFDLDNLRASCKRCNSARSARMTNFKRRDEGRASGPSAIFQR